MTIQNIVQKVFEYYESLGVLEVTPTTLPDTQPTDPVLANMFVYENNGRTSDQTWRTEQISVNDCFLKNMNLFRYIVNIDIDEVIVPTNKTGPTWTEMMEVLESVTDNQACWKNLCFYAPRFSLDFTSCFSQLELGDFGTPGFLMSCFLNFLKASLRTYT